MSTHQGITTPEAMFGLLTAGRFTFFVQGPPLSQSVPSGMYPLRPAVGGKTFVVDAAAHSISITSSPPPITATRMFLGRRLGIRPNGEGNQFELRRTEGTFERFLQRVSRMKNPEVIIRWFGERADGVPVTPKFTEK